MVAPWKLDTRPRCGAEGRYEGQPVPCELHKGHKGQHQWTKPMTGEYVKHWRSAQARKDGKL